MRPPNIILITADQLRWDCLGFTGNPDARTPNLDSLAAYGVSFTQAITPSPDSWPARASLLTGRCPWEHGARTAEAPLPEDAATLASCLRTAGYATAAIGKTDFREAWGDYGFDQVIRAEQSSPGRLDDDYHPWLEEQGKVDRVDYWDQVDRASAPPHYWKSLGAMRSNLPEEAYSTAWIGNQAVRYLQSAGEPFFLWVSFIKPHPPYDPPAPWDEMFDRNALTLPGGFLAPPPVEDAQRGTIFDPADMTEARFRKVLAYYHANISFVDRQVGRILATLTGRGLRNSAVAFTADHGDYMGWHGLLGNRGARPYDALLRIPLLIAGVAEQRRGTKDACLAQLHDVMPTLLDVAGVPTPPETTGVSLLPRLRGGGVPVRDLALALGAEGERVTRTARMKLIESDAPERRAWYDLDQDPWELDNRYAADGAGTERAALAQAMNVMVAE